jgi:hypothetical protein
MKTNIKGLVALALFSTAAVASAQIATMPPHSLNFTGSTRGYFFISPVAMTITGVEVLQDPTTFNGFMNFAVVKFDGAIPPPAFPGVTNAFTQEALGLDVVSGSLAPVSVNVAAGDVIGNYGNTTPTVGTTSGTNSYTSGAAQAQTTIDGNTVDLNRSGMQFHLGSATSPAGMHDIWSEGSFSISRVQFEYTVVPEPATFVAIGLGIAALALRR